MVAGRRRNKATGTCGKLLFPALLVVLAAACSSEDIEGFLCGDGTAVVDGQCVPVEGLCGEGTFRGPDGACKPVSSICEDGTTYDAGVAGCVATGGGFACGEGTRADGERCVPIASESDCPSPLTRDAATGACVIPDSVCGPGTVRDAGSGRCVAGEGGVCGEDEAWSAARGECVAVDALCGEGTRWDATAGFCLPGETWCGEGVVWDAAAERCVAEEIPCGAGTALDAATGLCLPSAAACGAGTQWSAELGTCALDGEVCGSGTARDGDRCVASAAVCGARTRWIADEGRCGPDEAVCGPGTQFSTFALGCIPDAEPGGVCGPNTVWDEEAALCVADPELCAGGTVRDADGLCRPAEEVCPTGTEWDAEAEACALTEALCAAGTALDPELGQCVPTAAVCGDGTVWNAETGRCTQVGLTCGPGTAFDGDSGTCRVDPGVCGAGTRFAAESGGCVAEASACGAGTRWDEDEEQCVVAETTCLEGTIFDAEAQGCLPSEDVCGPGTSWLSERRICVSGTYVDGSCDDPQPLDVPAGDVILAADSCFEISSVQTIGGARGLTIESGVTFLFAPAAGLVIGNRSTGANNPIVRMLGTEEAPIRFRGTQPQPGWWRGLVIGQTNHPTNLLEHVIVEHAGDMPWDEGVEVSRAGLLIESNFNAARLGLRHVTVQDNVGYGISIRSGRTPAGLCSQVTYVALEEFESVRATRNTAAPLRILADLVGHIDGDFDFTGNEDDRVHVYSVGCRSVFRDQTWRDLGVPMFSPNGLIVQGGAALVIEGGTEIHFAREEGFDSQGRLEIVGTAENPVVFRGAEDAPGSWRGVRVRDNNRPENRLEHLHISQAGSDAWIAGQPAALTLSGALTTALRHVRLEGNLGYGLVVAGNDVSLTGFENNVFTGNSEWPARIPARLAGVLDSGTVFSGNTRDSVHVSGIFVADTTLEPLDVPYFAAEELRVRNSAMLTLEAGVRIQFGLNTWLRVGESGQPGFLTVRGTSEQPVILEGSTPVPGWWRGLFIGNSLNPLNSIEHLTIRHGGSEQWSAQQPAANMHLTNTAGSTRTRIEGLRLEDGLGAGLFVSGGVDLLACDDVSFSNVEPEVIGSVAVFEDACGPLASDD